MELDYSEEQRGLAGLAREIFEGRVTQDRLREVEAGPDRFDAALWEECARANLLGVGFGEEHGGAGGGLVEVCALLEEQGRTVAPVPLWPALALGAQPISAFGSGEIHARLLPGIARGEIIPTAALPPDGEAPSVTESNGVLHGAVPMVPAATVATHFVVPTAGGLFLAGRGGAEVEPQRVTGGQVVGRAAFDGAAAERLAGLEGPAWLYEHALTGLCALQVGVSDAALRLTAAYLSEREQFEKPLGSFQAVQQRLADAYIDLQAMRWTMWQAAWRLDDGRPASEEVAIAKFWASDGGARVAEACQHLHGGIGVDVDYPLHRYTLWSKQIELTLGSAAHQLERLGELIA